ncbi:alpha-tocopherol transfer protein-like [Aricia agestis]|uniref:alpha-tocopherol transfer protein-like n=1 Tax=Aricia agestis TaxID=91739 RepID=UPI001C20AACC|nr:alpha-tocopherol transfer protein-like [Aricia agestis]
MESIPKNSVLEFHPDTLQYIRKQYDLDERKINESIDILEEWMKKQEHFVKKSFPREYLERMLVHNKGSVEKCKRKLDRLCTLRTLLPEFFQNINARDIKQDVSYDHLLPKMTPDYCRVEVFKLRDSKYNLQDIKQHLNLFVLISDYLQVYDYCNGVIYFGDWRDANPIEYAMSVNFSDFRKALDIAFEGYSMRIRAIHLLTGSKALDAFVALFKQVVSPKIGSRIMTHKSMETVYQHIPKDILPAEYGGTAKPIIELHENIINGLADEEFIKYRQSINEARTDENYRPKDIFNEYMGMPGTFRNLTVD